MRPFEFDGTLVEDQKFASLSLRQSSLMVRHLVGHFARTAVQVRLCHKSLQRLMNNTCSMEIRFIHLSNTIRCRETTMYLHQHMYNIFYYPFGLQFEFKNLLTNFHQGIVFCR